MRETLLIFEEKPFGDPSQGGTAKSNKFNEFFQAHWLILTLRGAGMPGCSAPGTG